MSVMDVIKQKAKKLNAVIVLPEGEDERTLKAASVLASDDICAPVILGNEKEIRGSLESFGSDHSGIQIIDPLSDDKRELYINEYFSIRKHKGMTLDQAAEVMKKPLFYGAMMVRKGRADGSVAGAMNATGNVLRAALQIIGLAEGIDVVSSSFLMILPEFQGEKEKLFIFADCAVMPDPDAGQLASIAISSAETMRKLGGLEPRVAMLSFSTKGSAKHDRVDKVLDALAIVKEKVPNLEIDGELQLDAAIIQKIGEKKAPGSSVAGNANVLIFPDLDSGNIGYKLVQRLAGAEAIGPVIQGLAKPANDLSRGCSVSDIVNVSAIASVLAKG